MSLTGKNRYWWAVLYPENMRSGWETLIGDILQVPYCYCKHTTDTDQKSEHRKDHIHLIIAFSNTTTYKRALEVFSLLNAPDRIAVNTCQGIVNIRNAYDYLLHDTETCKKLGKFLYPKEARICGNNFDIGSFEQVSVADKQQWRRELMELVKSQGFVNFMDFVDYVLENYDDRYLDIVASYSGLYERMTKGNYQRLAFRGKTEK